MKTLPACTLLVLALALASAHAAGPGDEGKPAPGAPAASAPAASATPSKGELKAMREFQLLDANGDGKLSRREVALFPRLAGAFDDADTNHDGFVSYDEVRAFAVKYRAERERQRQARAQAEGKAQGTGEAADGKGAGR